MKKYGNDYQRKENGYEYTGEWYGSSLGVEQLAKQANRCFVILLFATILFIAGLSFDNAGGRNFRILMPYVAMVFPMAYGWMGSASLYEFCRKQKQGKTERSDGSGRADSRVVVPEEQQGKMLRSEYEKGIRRPLRCGAAMVVFSSVALATNVGMLLRHSSELVLIREVCFAGITAGILCCSVVMTWQSDKIRKSFLHESTIKEKD